MSSENRVIDKIERLYAKAEKANTGGSAAAYQAAMLDLHSALAGNWPAIRDRLVAAEQYQKDSADRLVHMVEERTALERRLALAEKALDVKEQLNETLRRCCEEAKQKERAFEALVRWGTVCVQNGAFNLTPISIPVDHEDAAAILKALGATDRHYTPEQVEESVSAICDEVQRRKAKGATDA